MIQVMISWNHVTMWHNNVLDDFLKDWLDMTDDDVKRKIAKVVIAKQKTIDPSFKSYWDTTAKNLATKYNVSLTEIEQSPEYYANVKVSSIH